MNSIKHFFIAFKKVHYEMYLRGIVKILFFRKDKTPFSSSVSTALASAGATLYN